MKKPLAQIVSWKELAQLCNFNVDLLAARCGVAISTLERFFRATFRNTPHRWMHRLRLSIALTRIRRGARVKEIA